MTEKSAGGAAAGVEPWWVRGLLYENCTCPLLCPAHVSFRQACSGERCTGFWGIQIERGRSGGLVLDPQSALVLYESPPLMHEGGWTVQLCLDAAVSEQQRSALERILRGEAGGPWAILAQFVARWLDTRVTALRFTDEGRRKRLIADGVMETIIEGVESRKTGQTASLGNLFNVVHSAIQYLARGSSRVDAGAYAWTTTEKHALYSEFSWTGP